jgi:hypothetical protein
MQYEETNKNKKTIESLCPLSHLVSLTNSCLPPQYDFGLAPAPAVYATMEFQNNYPVLVTQQHPHVIGRHAEILF